METPKSAAVSGSTPIMTNSVVPMPKAPMASASSAMGTVLLSGSKGDCIDTVDGQQKRQLSADPGIADLSCVQFNRKRRGSHPDIG
ncbi:hypothetical protein GCM10027199_25910 [Amycolatopsis magusensis]